MDDDREYFTLNELLGISNNVYPLVYALKIHNCYDFQYAVVREAYYVGVSVLNNKPTHEVVFIDKNEGEILKEEEDAFPYNSLPSLGVFTNYDTAKEACSELNNRLLNEYKKCHFNYQIKDIIKDLKQEEEYEDKYVYKDINRGVDHPHIFSTVYVKTRKVN